MCAHATVNKCRSCVSKQDEFDLGEQRLISVLTHIESIKLEGPKLTPKRSNIRNYVGLIVGRCG